LPETKGKSLEEIEMELTKEKWKNISYSSGGYACGPLVSRPRYEQCGHLFGFH
jgi:hypothetical protein